MDSGPSGASAAQQHLVDRLVAKMTSVSRVAYLDDVIIFHSLVRRVYGSFRDLLPRGRSQPTATRPFEKETFYLDVHTSATGIRPDSAKTASMSKPWTRKVSSASWGGVESYYRRYMKELRTIVGATAAPHP